MAKPKYPTKQKRLCAMFECYLNLSGKTGVTTDEVAAWAMQFGLYPVPSIRSAQAECLAWEEKFASVQPKESN